MSRILQGAAALEMALVATEGLCPPLHHYGVLPLGGNHAVQAGAVMSLAYSVSEFIDSLKGRASRGDRDPADDDEDAGDQDDDGGTPPTIIPTEGPMLAASDGRRLTNAVAEQ